MLRQYNRAKAAEKKGVLDFGVLARRAGITALDFDTPAWTDQISSGSGSAAERRSACSRAFQSPGRVARRYLRRVATPAHCRTTKTDASIVAMQRKSRGPFLRLLDVLGPAQIVLDCRP
jgi:hypothetical protein